MYVSGFAKRVRSFVSVPVDVDVDVDATLLSPFQRWSTTYQPGLCFFFSDFDLFCFFFVCLVLHLHLCLCLSDATTITNTTR